MPTESISRDRRRVSSQSHEIAYAGKKLGKRGPAAVKKEKKALGRTTARTKVIARASSLTGK